MVSPRQKKATSIAAISAIAIVGAAALLFNTYPHLKPSFLSCSETKKTSPPPSLSDSTVLVSDKKVEEWSIDELKAFLEERQVSVPENASTVDLVALVNQLLHK